MRARSHNAPGAALVRMYALIGPHKLLAPLCSAALLAACQTPPEPAAPSEQTPRIEQPAVQPPVARPRLATPPQAPPPTPLADTEIRQLLDNARNLLDQGQEDAAVTDLTKVLESDPGQKTASVLMRSIREDPAALFGRESFPYRVVAGDTLAGIALRFLNDLDQFYALARYNGIKVPRQLPAGITIRIPGKPRSPAVQPTAPPAASPAAAPPASVPASAPPPTPVTVPKPETDAQRKARVDRLSRQARTSMARQDVCGAIGAWGAVLEIDPDNRTAILEREKAIELKRRLPGAKC